MLLIRIQNIDRSFFCVYMGDDPRTGAEEALKQLVENHGFFPDNVIIDREKMPSSFTPNPNIYGILMLKQDARDEWDIAHAIDDENTYWITHQTYRSGEVFAA